MVTVCNTVHVLPCNTSDIGLIIDVHTYRTWAHIYKVWQVCMKNYGLYDMTDMLKDTCTIAHDCKAILILDKISQELTIAFLYETQLLTLHSYI